MMRFIVAGVTGLALLTGAISTSAMAGTKDFALQGYALPADKPVTIVLMRPDVDVGELQGGGMPEPNADWTQAARLNIHNALRAELSEKNIQFVAMEERLDALGNGEVQQIAEMELAECEQTAAAQSENIPVDGPQLQVDEGDIVVCADLVEKVRTLQSSGEDRAEYDKLIAQYDALHAAVVEAILTHKYGYGGSTLPTKKKRFEYTLGPGTQELGDLAGANYGLFMLTYDQFASDSRKAMQVLGGLGCLIGACMIITGGQHIAYVSLVDLESGDIVWFNLLRGSKGDVREADGARDMVGAIMDGMPSRPGERTAGSGQDE